jgi:hypothetical protein
VFRRLSVSNSPIHLKKQIVLVAGLYHCKNIASYNVTVFFDDFSLTDRPLHQFVTTNEKVIRLVSFFDFREQVLAWANFRKYASHLIFFELIMIKFS